MLEAARRSNLPIDARELSAETLGATLEQLAMSGVRRIAVAGGDGTVSLAAGLASKLRIELAVIRGGTLNHLARDLGIPEVVDAFRLFVRLPVFTVEAEIEGKMQVYVTPLVFVGVGERELKLPKLGGRAPGGQWGLHVMIVRGRSRARIAALAFAAVARGT